MRALNCPPFNAILRPSVSLRSTLTYGMRFSDTILIKKSPAFDSSVLLVTLFYYFILLFI